MPGEKIIDRIQSLQAEGKQFVSFEFFPPKTADGVRSLMTRIERYREQGAPTAHCQSPYHPLFLSLLPRGCVTAKREQEV